jgi:hypothetical protein
MDLVKLAGLESSLGATRAGNPAFDIFWDSVSDWTEESRYQHKSQQDAEQLYEAITNNPNWVLEWMRQHW